MNESFKNNPSLAFANKHSTISGGVHRPLEGPGRNGIARAQSCTGGRGGDEGEVYGFGPPWLGVGYGSSFLPLNKKYKKVIATFYLTFQTFFTEL